MEWLDAPDWETGQMRQSETGWAVSWARIKTPNGVAICGATNSQMHSSSEIAPSGSGIRGLELNAAIA